MLSVLLPTAAVSAIAAVDTAAGRAAVGLIAVGWVSIGHLRDACGVRHGGLTTPDLVTCC